MTAHQSLEQALVDELERQAQINETVGELLVASYVDLGELQFQHISKVLGFSSKQA